MAASGFRTISQHSQRTRPTASASPPLMKSVAFMTIRRREVMDNGNASKNVANARDTHSPAVTMPTKKPTEISPAGNAKTQIQAAAKISTEF